MASGGPYTEPLSFSPTNFSTSAPHSSNNFRQKAVLPTQLHMTPPLTPHSSHERMVDRNNHAGPIFHNFLRAFYPFHPDGPVTSSSITLPLDQGDLILVHSVHTNGWADGTLLETGARGWLPTNYCEAYDQAPMQPLLKALSDFWDFIRSGSGANLYQFADQDYMKGLIAGVRFLLEQAECLGRDDELVRKIDGLRRNRKALLSDLSALVKLAKRLQDVAHGGALDEPLDNIFDHMLLRAFKSVTRGVRFLDVWNEEVGLSRAMAEFEDHSPRDFTFNAPLTPPVDAASLAISSPEPTPTYNQPQSCSTSNLPAHDSSSQQARLSANRVSHRISYNGNSSATRNPNFASEQLGNTHDTFLGVLGSFIGLHLQSRSSSELLLTTQQSVHSCRKLLAVVEQIWEHDLRRSELLLRAKNSIYEKITELVHAAREVFQPDQGFDDEALFMPDGGKRLMDAATDCVRGAGECVARARQVLEQIGDFEIENVGLGITTTAPAPASNSEKDSQGPASLKFNPSSKPISEQHNHPTTRDGSHRVPPPLQIPSNNTSNLSLTPALTNGTTPSSPCLVQTPVSTSGEEPPSCTFSSFGELNDPLIPLPEHGATHDFRGDFRGTALKKVRSNSSLEPNPNHTSMGTGSDITYVNVTRDSETSSFSQTSTRVATPDGDNQAPLSPLKNSVPATLMEEPEECEESLLKKTFAHELMFKDGQVIGGTLRALVEKLTSHQSTPDALFVSAFYLTFRHFAAPTEVAGALIDRFDYVSDTPSIAGPVRLRVYNIFKGWLESHWRHDCDDIALPTILKFARTKLISTLPSAGNRLIELVNKVSAMHGPVVPRLVSSIGKTNTSSSQHTSPDIPTPPPTLSRSQTNLLKQWKNGTQSISILDFDSMEIARQLTIKASVIFCAILPEELLGTEWMKKSGSLAVNVRAMSTLSTDIANLVADSILQLEEPKKRALVIKQWVKISSKCLELNNYDTLMAVVCSLNSSTISRLKRTWELVSQKTKTRLEQLREIVDVSRNYAVLRQRLQNHVPPCLPFVGTYLTDLTFVDHGNQNTRSLPIVNGSMDVINFDKHMKTAKIISELQRFQIPYRLCEVPELQAWIQDQLVRVRSAGEKTFQAHYRRSLVLEPRQQPTPRTSPGDTSIFSRDNTKEKFDFLSWRNKAIAS